MQLPSQSQQNIRSETSIKIQINKVDTVIRTDPKKQIVEGNETDVQFIEDVLQIAKFTKINRKEGDLHHITEEEYQFIQRQGEKHYQANLFNDSTTRGINKPNQQKKCKCGCNRQGGQHLPFCIDVEEEPYFGSAVVLFFYYNRHLFQLILMIIFVYGIYALTTNLVIANYTLDCTKPGALPFMCEVKIFTSLQGKKGRDDLLLVQLILGVVFCTIWVFVIRVVRDKGRKKNKDIDDVLESSADYWIMIDGFPIGQYNEQDVLNFLQQLWNDIDDDTKGKLRIKGVQICYKMDEVRSSVKEIQDLAIAITEVVEKKGEKYEVQNREIYRNIKMKILKLYKGLLQFRTSFVEDKQFRKSRSSTCIFVNFQSSKQQEILLQNKGVYRMTVPKEAIEKLKQNCCSKFKFPTYKDQYLRLIKAPEPSDVLWSHCEYQKQKRYVILVWIINTFLILCSLACFFFIRFLKQQNPDVNGLSSLGLITLNLFNRLIWNVLGKVIVLQKNYTKTDNLISIMNKNYVASSMNIIAVPLIVTGFVDGNFISPSGLTGTIHDYQITSFLFFILFNLINLPYRWSQIVRCIQCLRRKAIQKTCKIFGKLDNYSQIKQAITQVYEPPPLPIVGIYVFITSTLMQAAFFCQGSPIVFFYMGVSMILFRIVNRWLLLRVCKIPDMIDFLIFQVCIGFAMNVPLLYGVGSLFLLGLSGYAPNNTYYIPSIVCIIIWFISIANPCSILSRMTSCCTEERSVRTEETKENNERGMELFGNVLQQTGEGEIKNDRTKRLQSYYSNSSISVMFNFESQLRKVQGPFHGQTQSYCEKHQLNMNMNMK